MSTIFVLSIIPGMDIILAAPFPFIISIIDGDGASIDWVDGIIDGFIIIPFIIIICIIIGFVIGIGIIIIICGDSFGSIAFSNATGRAILASFFSLNASEELDINASTRILKVRNLFIFSREKAGGFRENSHTGSGRNKHALTHEQQI